MESTTPQMPRRLRHPKVDESRESLSIVPKPCIARDKVLASHAGGVFLPRGNRPTLMTPGVQLKGRDAAP